MTGEEKRTIRQALEKLDYLQLSVQLSDDYSWNRLGKSLVDSDREAVAYFEARCDAEFAQILYNTYPVILKLLQGEATPLTLELALAVLKES